MSLIPHVLSDMYRHPIPDMYRPHSIFDQDFGLGILCDDLIHPRNPMYYRPWRHRSARQSGISHVQNSKDGFKVNLDVQQFKPEEVVVKTVGNTVVVEGKHEERPDEHGYIARNFLRRYTLPDDVDPATVASTLSSDGILSIEAPKKALPPAKGEERVIPITHTNAPAVTEVPAKPVKPVKTSQDKMKMES